jgi:hypothetical protein
MDISLLKIGFEFGRLVSTRRHAEILQVVVFSISAHHYIDRRLSKSRMEGDGHQEGRLGTSRMVKWMTV